MEEAVHATSTGTSTLASVESSEATHSGIEVSLRPEVLGHIGSLPVTNTLITSWVVIAVLTVVAVSVGRKVSLIPSRIQTFFELTFGAIYDFMDETLENRMLAKRLFPILMTIFLFIATSNLLEFTPGIGSVGFFHPNGTFAPLLRSVNTDLNTTLALTFVVMFLIEFTGIAMMGIFKYAGKFINFSSPLNFIVGIIELVSELSRLVSFSFRLFGNVFAGEVLLAVVAFFVPYVLPVPLMAFEMFVGVIQAIVFVMLTLFFIKLAVMEPHAEH